MKRYVWLCIALFSAACADQPTAPVDAPDLALGASLMLVTGVQGGGVAGFDLADGSDCDETVIGNNFTPEGLVYSFHPIGTFQTDLSRSAPCAYAGYGMRVSGHGLEVRFHSIAMHPPLDWNPTEDYTVSLFVYYMGAPEGVMQDVTVPGSGWSEVLLPFGPDVHMVDVNAPGFYDDLTWWGPITDPQDKAECKNGGWESFGFKNQGQCARFVETGRGGR